MEKIITGIKTTKPCCNIINAIDMVNFLMNNKL